MPNGEASFLSPEAIIMLPFAILIDLIGIVLIFFALDDFWITDIVAFTFIGGWSYFRSQIRGKEQAETPSFDAKRKLKGFRKQMKKTKK